MWREVFTSHSFQKQLLVALRNKIKLLRIPTSLLSRGQRGLRESPGDQLRRRAVTAARAPTPTHVARKRRRVRCATPVARSPGTGYCRPRAHWPPQVVDRDRELTLCAAKLSVANKPARAQRDPASGLSRERPRGSGTHAPTAAPRSCARQKQHN